MKRALSMLAVAAVLMAGQAKAQYAVGAEVGSSTGNFEGALQPYGMWLQHPSYGRVWQPSVAVVGSGFYPYGTGGQWMWTDAGWSFESSYPFGWATFHYGRWVFEPGYGWVWIPGYEWAPAWVSWRTGGPYVGWAPLGPYGAPAYASSHWCFVERNSFTMPNVYGRALGSGRFHEAMAVTQPWAARQGPAREFVGGGYAMPPGPRGSGWGPGSRHREELRPSVMGQSPMGHGVFAPQPMHERFEGGRHGGFEAGLRAPPPRAQEFSGGAREYGSGRGFGGGSRDLVAGSSSFGGGPRDFAGSSHSFGGGSRDFGAGGRGFSGGGREAGASAHVGGGAFGGGSRAVGGGFGGGSHGFGGGRHR